MRGEAVFLYHPDNNRRQKEVEKTLSRFLKMLKKHKLKITYLFIDERASENFGCAGFQPSWVYAQVKYTD